jgi:NAD(P)-dependent dehydrogenase (short-subunit alcohol dehydrogenase family)
MTVPIDTILITGAAQGVGLATAGLLAQRECRVILVDIQSVEQQVAQLQSRGLHA